MKLTAKLKKAIMAHADECYPLECCGVIVDKQYIACRNIAEQSDQFEIHPEDLASAEDQGEILAYVHSHPDGTTKASELDLIQIELHQKPWVICSYPDLDFQVYEPFGYRAPLVGRNYIHHYQDCYALVRDFYDRELGIKLPDFERKDGWWEDKDHPSILIDNFPKAGFYEVDTPQYGDMLICRVPRTEHPNHCIIWLGDNAMLKSEDTEPCIGNTLILHQLHGRKSIREIYGPQWSTRTVKILRHRDVKNN
ncbi:C40 family peptidase [Acinetobacter baumannii]|nr:C40 family peptidase [Acinetobacter baumannii]